jgi:hypothetical protein
MVQPEKFLTVSYKYEATLNDWGKNKKIPRNRKKYFMFPQLKYI